MNPILIWIIAGIIGTVIIFLITRDETHFTKWYKPVLLSIFLISFGYITLGVACVLSLIKFVIWCTSED